MPKIDPYLKRVHEVGGSDLHLESATAPKVRIHGKLTALADKPTDPAVVSAAMRELMTDRQWEWYAEHRVIDFSYDLQDIARFRVHCEQSRLGTGAFFRRIPTDIASVADLGLPAELLKVCDFKSGLFVVAGGTGSGKSTTIAALIDCINTNNQKHVIIVEDPVEFVHKPKRCHITHREVGSDTESFAAALRTARRGNADVMVVGDLRDEDTIRAALVAAESGALVIGAVETQTAIRAIDKLVNAFSESEQPQIRGWLATLLKGVSAQALIPRADGKGRVSVTELLFSSFALGNMIREGNFSKIAPLIEAGRSEGLISMDESILGRVKEGAISGTSAYQYAIQKPRFESLLKP